MMKHFNTGDSVKVWYVGYWNNGVYRGLHEPDYLDYPVHAVSIGVKTTLWFKHDHEVISADTVTTPMPCEYCGGIGHYEFVNEETGEPDGIYCSMCNGGGWVEVQVQA